MRVLKLTSNPAGTALPAPTSASSAPSGKEKIALPTLDGIHIESVSELLYLKADGNYTVLHFSDHRKLVVCKTLRDMEAQLEDAFGFFVRIHRSYSVNLDKVRRYIRGKGGQVILDNDLTLDVSASRRQAFCQALTRYFA